MTSANVAQPSRVVHGPLHRRPVRAPVAGQDQDEHQNERQQNAIQHLHADQQLDHRHIWDQRDHCTGDEQRAEQPDEHRCTPEIEVDALAEAERLADRVGRGQRQDTARDQSGADQTDGKQSDGCFTGHRLQSHGGILRRLNVAGPRHMQGGGGGDENECRDHDCRRWRPRSASMRSGP